MTLVIFFAACLMSLRIMILVISIIPTHFNSYVLLAINLPFYVAKHITLAHFLLVFDDVMLWGWTFISVPSKLREIV
jgi:hypothetical protein